MNILRLGLKTLMLLSGVYLLLCLAWHADRIPPMPQSPFDDHDPMQTIVQALYRVLEPGESFASSVLGVHVWYNQGSNAGTGLAPGNTIYIPVNLPVNTDHLAVCFEFNFASFVNTGFSTAYASASNGTSHSEDSGCPLWPYNNTSGHMFPPGFIDDHHLGTAIPSNGNAVETMDFRQDGMYFNSPSACGGPLTINSLSCAAGTCTANLASNPEGAFGSGLWSGIGNGEYAQITGSSVAGDNTIPGQVLTLNGRTTSSLSFPGNLPTCVSSCGVISQPWLGGSPPVSVPLGFDGGVPTTSFGVVNANNSGASVNFSQYVNILCFPLMSCPNPNAAGCGIPGANTMQ